MDEPLVVGQRKTGEQRFVFVLLSLGAILGASVSSLVGAASRRGEDGRSPVPARLSVAAGDVSGCEQWGCPVPPAHNNGCMEGGWRPPPGPRTLDCPRFVIESTDQTWHSRSLEAAHAAIDRYFAPHWLSVRAFGTVLNGREGLRAFMEDWLMGFPDVFIYVSDVFCEGNDDIGYKTTMPYVLTATNSGPSSIGNATGRRIKYHGIANCYILKIDGQWQYTSEWDVPDMLSYLNALDISSTEFPHPAADMMTIDECKPLFEWGTGKMNWFPNATVDT